MKALEAVGNGFLFLICGGLSFLYCLAVALAAGYQADTRGGFSGGQVPQYMAIWIVPVALGGVACLFPISKGTKIATAAGFVLPALLILPSLLQSFAK